MMRLASPFERRMRPLVRQQVRSSDVLWKEYVRRKRAAFRETALSLVGVLYVGVAGTAFLTVSMMGVAAGPGLFTEERPWFGKGNGDVLPLAFQAIMFASWFVVSVSTLRIGLHRARDLACVASFPLSDQQYLCRRLAFVAASSIGVALLNGAVMAYLSWQLGLSLGGWVVMTGLVLSQAVVFAAANVVAFGYTRLFLSETASVFVAIPFFFGGFSAAMAGTALLPYEREVSWPAFALLHRL
ncbi:MAG TPA: hypothetical protein VGX76_19635, partial [Pirellulales bacterium]|nr:hypothetical protein [Pirellulales bacterium]